MFLQLLHSMLKFAWNIVFYLFKQDIKKHFGSETITKKLYVVVVVGRIHLYQEEEIRFNF